MEKDFGTRLNEAIFDKLLSIQTSNMSLFKAAPEVHAPQVEPTSEQPQLEESASSSLDYYCRNKVYRQGTTKRCLRPSAKLYCEDCTKALEESKSRLLGLSENKKEPSNKPDKLEIDDKFEVHDDYDEEKKEPNDKQKRKSSLQNGPEGAKQPKNSPYLK